MVTWNKVQKLAAADPWLTEALTLSHHCDDDRELRERTSSMAFITFRPFKDADPNWKGSYEFHPFFGSSRAGECGASCTAYPIIVLHYKGQPGYAFSRLISDCDATARQSMEWYITDASNRNMEIVFDAIVKPLVVKIAPHRIFAECYEVYKFPADFNFKHWIFDAEFRRVFSGVISGEELRKVKLFVSGRDDLRR